MFTGIIEEVGNVSSLSTSRGTATLAVKASKVLSEVQLGDSIAVNGVCLTVRHHDPQSFQAELSQETLERSALGRLRPGDKVNLERPLLPTSRLGGHFVQGHVDGVGQVVSVERQDEFAMFEFSLPDQVAAYVVEKGSIAVDGISLTVARLGQKSFQVAIVPHTLENTNLAERRPGHSVNLECDVLAKYVESILKKKDEPSRKSRLTLEYLKEQGY